MLKPVAVPPGHCRSSSLLFGLGGTGKTTLIRALSYNPSAYPQFTTTGASIYHTAQLFSRREREGAKSSLVTYHFYFADYGGQDLSRIVREFILQQKQPYSPFCHGYITSLIFVVDLIGTPPSSSIAWCKPDHTRVVQHIAAWNGHMIDAISGMVSGNSLKFVGLFVNKADLLERRSPTEDANLLKRFKPLMDQLRLRFSTMRSESILGSARTGEGLVQLQQGLIGSSDCTSTQMNVDFNVVAPLSSAL